MPEVIFLDPIYHPAIRKDGHCCCCFFKKSYRPTTPLVDLIRSILNTIDNSDLKHCCSDFVLADEYHNNYEQFYEKALEYTLKYGRPRY
jgi:ubiquitin-protein ligase